MTRNELLIKISSALETEQILDDKTKIIDIEEWDSLSSLSIIALFDELFSVKINRNQLNKLKTIEDLIEIIKDKIE